MTNLHLSKKLKAIAQEANNLADELRRNERTPKQLGPIFGAYSIVGQLTRRLNLDRHDIDIGELGLGDACLWVVDATSQSDLTDKKVRQSVAKTLTRFSHECFKVAREIRKES
jgi:hypothetical protein